MVSKSAAGGESSRREKHLQAIPERYSSAVAKIRGTTHRVGVSYVKEMYRFLALLRGQNQ